MAAMAALKKMRSSSGREATGPHGAVPPGRSVVKTWGVKPWWRSGGDNDN